MPGPAIEFDGVSLTLGATRILQDVSFRVRSAPEADSIVVPIGPDRRFFRLSRP